MTPILTDSEWQIMRVLWEKNPASATEIAETLLEVKSWGITTVKTFLARLVHKKIVSYKEQGKKFLYTPLLSERDFVVSEMKQVLNRIYGGKLLYHTDHFEFFGFDNPELIKRLAKHLESHFEHIEKRYQMTSSERQQVYMYRSKQRLHSALGLTTGPEWLRGGWEWGILHLAPEEAFDDVTIEAAAMMIWMQKILFTKYPETPYWLIQGIASVESQLIDSKRFNKAMLAEIPSLNSHTILNLDSQYELFKVHHGFELTSTVVEFIVQLYGWDRLLQFANRPNDYQGIFGCNETSFWDAWMNDTQSRYAMKAGQS